MSNHSERIREAVSTPGTFRVDGMPVLLGRKTRAALTDLAADVDRLNEQASRKLNPGPIGVGAPEMHILYAQGEGYWIAGDGFYVPESSQFGVKP